MIQYPKVLIISHNVFSESGNMGRTMANLLSVLPPDHMAQFYFHSEIPTIKTCKKYFRVTDKDVLKSVLTRKARYKIYEEKDIREEVLQSRTDKGMTAKVYQFSRKRTPMIYFMRNLIWNMGRWNSKALDSWIRDFNPDMIFFASGDYSFAYKIAYKIAKKYNLPMIMWCVDDYYLSRKQTVNPIWQWNQKNLVKWARRIADLSDCILTISDKMQEDYRLLFGKRTEVIRIASKESENYVPMEERQGIVYAGNLGINRINPLLELGKAFKKASLSGYDRIHVYSGERDENKISYLTDENGIRFHGSVSQKELADVLAKARYLLHVEAFDDAAKRRTMYSLSTKIGDSLASGACLIAYGPEDISSMSYLKKNEAAVMIEDAEEAPVVVKQLNECKEAYETYLIHAKELVAQCHNKEKNDELMMKILGIK